MEGWRVMVDSLGRMVVTMKGSTKRITNMEKVLLISVTDGAI